MESLQAITATWLMIVIAIQTVVFITCPSDDRTLWQSYTASWMRTLYGMYRFFVPGNSVQERRFLLGLWFLAVLCLPGGILAVSTLARMAQ